MGFQRRPLVLDQWEAEELQGLVVRAHRLSVAEVRTIVVRQEGVTREERERTIEDVVASAVVEWNYEDKSGNPVEPTAENLDQVVDPALVGELVDELVRRSSQVAPPLPRPSDDGSPSEAEFNLTEALSSDPPNSPGPS